MNSSFHIQNRTTLSDQLKDNSLLVVFSGRSVRRTADDFYPFFANRNFVYLVGADMENFTYVAAKQGGAVSEWLFIEEPNQAREAWTGRRMTIEEAQATTGIQNVLFEDGFLRHLHNLIQKGCYDVMYLDFDMLAPSQPHTPEQRFAALIKADYPHIALNSIYPLVRRMRTYKSPEEIENLRKAVRLTGKGLRAIWSACKPGMREYELETEFKYALAKEGCRNPAFKPIVSSGANNFYLHYDKPMGTIGEGDLVLCDVGAMSDGYCADISRVFPASGRFSERQRAIYEASLAGVLAAQAVGRPGCTFEEFNLAAREEVQQRLQALGLVKEPDDLKKYMWHGLAHHVGLDVHDVGIYDVPMAENMVFTLDVGIYVREWNVGLRIEDNVLVTADSMVNLAEEAGIPKAPDELEALLAR